MKFLCREQMSEHKYKTPEGYLVCVDSVLARTGKQEYLRSEVFADSDFDGVIEVDRKPEEVFSEATLASFENKPITVEHPDVDVNSENYKTYSVGFVRDVHKGMVDGQEVILGTLVIQDAKTIDEIENGEHCELSCGYDCDIVDEANPQQRNIRGNHVALCEQGRAGNARIVDTAVSDMALSRADAIDRCISLGKKFIGHFDKVYKNPNDNAIQHWKCEMKGWLKSVKEIKLKNTNKPILNSELHDWFFTAGAEPKDFMQNPTNEEIETYDKFIVNCLASGIDSAFQNTKFVEDASVKVFYTQRRGVIYVFIDYHLVGKFSSKNEAKEAGYDIDGAIKFNANYIIKDMEDSMNDAVDYGKKSQQGYPVIRKFEERNGRLHVILKRANDYIVASGYDREDGTWDQGYYGFKTPDECEIFIYDKYNSSRRVSDGCDEVDDSAETPDEKQTEELKKGVEDAEVKLWKVYLTGGMDANNIMFVKAENEELAKRITKKNTKEDILKVVEYSGTDKEKILANPNRYFDSIRDDKTVYAVKAKYQGTHPATILEWYVYANSEKEAFEKIKKQPGHKFDTFVSAKIIREKPGMHIIDSMKKFEIDDGEVIHIVKAENVQDALKKIKTKKN